MVSCLQGGVIIISHQREFYSALCPEVWSVVDGRCTVTGSEWMDAAEKARKKAEKEAAKTAMITKEDKFDAFGNKIVEKQAKKKCPKSELKKIKKRVADLRKRGQEIWTDEEVEKDVRSLPAACPRQTPRFSAPWPLARATARPPLPSTALCALSHRASLPIASCLQGYDLNAD